MELTRICTPFIPSNPLTFILYRGITHRSLYYIKDDEGKAMDLTFSIVTFYIVTTEGTEILTIDSNTPTANGSKIIINDAVAGEIEILITDEETSNLPLFDNGRWWITITLTNGDILLKGKGCIYLKEVYD